MASSRKAAPNLWQGGSPTSKSCFVSPQKILTVGRQPVPVSPRGQVLAPAPGIKEDHLVPQPYLAVVAVCPFLPFGLEMPLHCPVLSHTLLEASALRLSQEQQSQLVLQQLALPQHAPAQAEDVAMARSIHSLVPPRPAQGDPPSGRLDFPS